MILRTELYLRLISASAKLARCSPQLLMVKSIVGLTRSIKEGTHKTDVSCPRSLWGDVADISTSRDVPGTQVILMNEATFGGE